MPFLEPLQYEFMQRALVAVVMVGIISGVVGCYVVIRGMSFFGDALSHSILPGVAISYIATGGASGANLFSPTLTIFPASPDLTPTERLHAVAEVMRRAGHASTAAAMRYQHAADERDAEVARRMTARTRGAEAARDQRIEPADDRRAL